MEQRSFQSGRPDPHVRNQNLEMHFENTVKHNLAVKEVMSLLQRCEDLEVVKLEQTCHVNLVVRNPGSKVGLGLSVKATKTKAPNEFFFSRCRKSPSILNICTAFPSLVNKPFLWWIIPGDDLCDQKSGALSIHPAGKWSRFEVHRERIADAVLKELKLRAAHQLPLVAWNLPRCEEHQKEQNLLSQMKQKIFTPLGSKVEDSKTTRGPIDLIIDSIQVKNKTACAVKDRRGLKLNIYKQNGHTYNGRATVQPYSVDDGIDAIIVNVHKNMELIGVFIFPKEEIVKRGWLQGNGHAGKVSALVYPPDISPRKGRGSAQVWQSAYYLGLSAEVDLDRARMLIDGCKARETNNR